MNSETLVQFVQRGWRVTLGATASIIETLQDPLRREENFSKLQSDLSQLTEAWEAKGETTELQARSFVDAILNQQTRYRDASAPASATPPSTSAATSAAAAPASASTSLPSPDIQRDLQELTAQIAAIRSELERLQQQDS